MILQSTKIYLDTRVIHDEIMCEIILSLNASVRHLFDLTGHAHGN